MAHGVLRKVSCHETAMRMAWCWRCRARMPMLDEREFDVVLDAYRRGVEGIKLERSLRNKPLHEDDETKGLAEVAARYHEITHVSGVDAREILKHRLSRLGPPCRRCGKELRSPRAKRCLECGLEVE